MKFDIINLACGYGKKEVISGFNFSLQSGDILSILGSNGVGKTTIFKTILGFIKPFCGDILVDKQSIFKLNLKQKAKFLSYVPQYHILVFDFKVKDIVLMSKIANKGMFYSPKDDDFSATLQSLEKLNIKHFKDRIYTDLSGGERQMVLIARALNQGAKIIMLDEPTANLDFANQIKVLKAIKELSFQGYIIIMTTHTPSQVFYLGSKVALISKDRQIYGEAKDVINDENLKEIYKTDIKVVRNLIDEKEYFSCIIKD